MPSRLARTVIIFTFCLLLFAASVGAQAIPGVFDNVDLILSTPNPAPGQTVTVTAKSFTIDVNSSTLTWTVDGAVVQKGVGLITLEVVAPALGKKKTLTVTAVTSGGASITNSIDIGSGSVDMVIESDGFVPPLYRGKLPISYQNNITVIAVPHLANSSGVEYDPKTLIYQWKRNSRLIQDQSGYGKQSITLRGDDVPRPFTLTLDITTRDSSAQASGYASIAYEAPTISFFVNDPLYGPLFNRSIGETVRIGTQKETGIIAVPLGFNKPASGLGDLQYTWSINSLERPELALNQSIILRTPEQSTGGTSNIELAVQSVKNVLQSSRAGFSVLFSAQNAESTSTTVTF